MIGVTGASGHLGQVLMKMIPDAYPIGRVVPDFPLTGLIHAAAPNHRDATNVIQFDEFNADLHDYLSRFDVTRCVVVGSWWQDADGECRKLLYTALKDNQRKLFAATHVVPFSIYGDDARTGRGFIPQLIKALRENAPLVGLSDQPRDFIHVTDVARACIAALDIPHGVYLAATFKPVSPRQLAERYGISAPDYVEFPSALPNYNAEPVPGWEPLIDVDDHIKSRIP